RKFSLRGIEKVHTEFGIVALAHNLLKVAGIRELLSVLNEKNTRTGGEKRFVFRHLFYFRDLLDSPVFFKGSVIQRGDIPNNGKSPKHCLQVKSYISYCSKTSSLGTI
ncbi:hypothetical protein, partial [Sporosarcina sp. USHLN248]|uniref:hypothetical protein n=1 Tax=Sporosarcina sp. USHLN248 TaxID=3081300 RepID=UPI0038B5ECD7